MLSITVFIFEKSMTDVGIDNFLETVELLTNAMTKGLNCLKI